MADAAVGFLLENLTQLLRYNLESHQERRQVEEDNTKNEVKEIRLELVNNEVKEIRAELMMIKSFLKDADARQSKEERVREWVRQIKALAYRIEDVIEMYVIHIQSRNEMRTNERSMKRILNNIIRSIDIKVLEHIRPIMLEIQDIKNKLTILRMNKEAYGIAEYYPKCEQLSLRMGKDIDLLVSSMFDESQNCQFISICGIVDKGRTILARQLFNHNRIQRHFQPIAWVHIPQEFSTRIIFERILRQLFNPPEQRIAVREVEETELVEKLCAFQQEHRCLIVLDNIPSRHAWERLQIAFPSGKTASKILITTRSLEVAEMASTGKGLIHTMTSLTEEDAWELFHQYVSLRDGPELNTVESEMENIGEKIVTRREDLDPDILALGKAFTAKYPLQQWDSVNKDTEEFEGIKKVQQALTSTYNDLPFQLKPCLFYLATFKKDTEIKPEKLYHLWIADGLLSSDNYRSETMVQMAETYLNELQRRGFVNVQEGVVTTARRFKSCSLHDLIHDFCFLIGRQEEFFVVMENEVEQEFDNSSWTERTWRLVIYLGQHDNYKSLVRLNKKLRCLLVRNAWENQESATHEILPYLTNCILKRTCLRILDFDGIDFGSWTLPTAISDLVHLRNLSFTGCLLKTLPKSICKLPYLQILDLRVRTGCKMEIPNVLHKMKRLRHLYLPLEFQTRDGVKLKLAGLTQLETLENFNTVVCNVEDLFTFTKISYLSVNIEESVEGLKRLADHMNLTTGHEVHSSLNVKRFDCYSEERHAVFRQLLACPALHVLVMEGHLGQIPLSSKISEKLTRLLLSGSELQIDPMPTLEMLPKLQMLILTDDAFAGKKIICSRSNFPELRHLQLSNLSHLESWSVEETAMPKLSSLKIENCSQLKMLSDGLQFLTNLRELKILRMPKAFKDRLRIVNGVRGADMDKVPLASVIFDNDNESSE